MTVAPTLSGNATVTVTNSPNTGVVVATWVASGQSAVPLITQFEPTPQTNDYSFVWPTQKYLDASGTLRVYYNSTSSTPVSVAVTLSNGNTSDFQHNASDWQSFLPNPAWTDPSDPVVAAVGDGASNQQPADALADAIDAANPPLFLYLGDIYEDGTATENLDHYGQNSMDGGSGTLWGQLGDVTQPAIGDHEVTNAVAWRDYFHGRPLYTAFRFANVLFLDLQSPGTPMKAGSAEYNFVKDILTSTTDPAPPCIVTYFQNPVIAKSTVVAKRVDMWKLLTNNGGDLVLNGNAHTMIQYKPLNDQLQLPSAGQPTMVELIDGAGGHGVGATFTGDSRIEWSQGKTPGAVWITLNGAANGGTPTTLTWQYEDTKGDVLHTGTRDCGAAATPPAPAITSFSPPSGPAGTVVTINGSDFTNASGVAFNGTSATAFTVNSDTKITATVPNATTGPISVTGPGGTGTSATDFVVTTVSATLTFTPVADTWVQSDTPATNYGTRPVVRVDNGAASIKHGLLRFTVSGVGSSTIASVALRLYCTAASVDGGTIHPVADTTWIESGAGGVTWNTEP
ncbi:MAG: CBM96 family carbohydrate-binding protein, partial [Actinomycetota bacterium]